MINVHLSPNELYPENRNIVRTKLVGIQSSVFANFLTIRILTSIKIDQFDNTYDIPYNSKDMDDNDGILPPPTFKERTDEAEKILRYTYLDAIFEREN